MKGNAIGLVCAAVVGCSGSSAPPAAPQTTPNPPGYRDSDGDQILDVCDKCPTEAELYNGHDDDDGCPEEVVVTANEDRWFQPLFFERGSAVMRAESGGLLDGDAAFYRRHPEYERIACLGFASEDEEAPKLLSHRRAQALCSEYERRGISPVRLVAYGAGIETKSSNRDPAYRRYAISRVVLYAGARVARWNGRALEPLDEKERYRAKPPAPRAPEHPICPSGLVR